MVRREKVQGEMRVPGGFGTLKGLLELGWKFQDARSVHKSRMDRLELPLEVLNFVKPLNRQLKTSLPKGSALSLCTVTSVFLVLIPFFFREFTHSPVPLPNWTLVHIISIEVSS